MVETALDAVTQVVAGPALVAQRGVRGIPALVRSGDVPELRQHLLHHELDAAALCEVEAPLGLGPERPAGIAHAVALTVALDCRRAGSSAL